MITNLKKARLDAGFKTATEAIQKFGWIPSVYRNHESGSLKFDMKTANVYAKAYGISLNYLISDELETPIKMIEKSK